MSANTDYIDKAYPIVKPDFRVWDSESCKWLETFASKAIAICEAMSGSDRYAICMNIGQLDRNGEQIYVDHIVKYAYNWDHEGGLEEKNRVFKKDTKKQKGYQLGIVKYHAETATYVLWPYRNTCLADSMLIEVVGNIHDNPGVAETIQYPYDEKGYHIKK